jgi:uncharacterized membrane protein
MTEHDGSGLQLERIVFFSDAVFAIAITLLIIEIKVPHLEHDAPDRDFWLSLVKLIPSFIGYFFSFFVIGAYWVGHHRIYGHIESWNYGLVWRNVLFLMAIAFMPFSTAFFSEYFPRFVPLVLYAATFSAAGLLQLWQWRYAISRGLVENVDDPAVGVHLSWRLMLLPTVGAAAILIGLINPLFSGFAFFTLPIMQQLFKRRFAGSKTEPTDLEIEAGEVAD